MFRWIRRLVRRKTGPIARDVAEEWKSRLAKAYMFIGFNIMALLLYASKKGNLELSLNTDATTAQQNKYSHMYAGKHVQYYKVQGLTVLENYEITPDGNVVHTDAKLADENDELVS